MSEKPKCQGKMYTGWCGFVMCLRGAKIERDGKWYCGTHDPEAVAARKKKREDKWREKWDAEKEREAQSKARCVGLGCGNPSGYGVYLTLAEADALIARLAEARP